MDGAISVQLFGVKVPSGKSIKVSTDNSDSRVTTTQITQVALGEKAGAGRTVIFCSDGHKEWVIGSLTPGRCEQFQTDYMGRHEISLRHTGTGDVYVSGFKTITLLEDEDSEEEPDFEGSSSEEDEEDEEPGADMAALVGNGRPGAKAKAAAKTAADDESGDSEDEEDGSDDEDGLQGQDFSDMDDEGEESEEDEDDEEGSEEDEEEEGGVDVSVGAKRSAAATRQPAAAKKPKAAAAAATPGGDPGAYEKAVRAFLRKEGPTSLSTLGSKVPGRPASMKMKKFVEDRPKLFKIDAEGKVHLAK